MIQLSIKVVPGAKRDRIVGRYGDGFKVQVSAPPEDGKANKAVEALLAAALGLKPQQVAVVRGHSNPRKIVQVEATELAAVEAKLIASSE